MSKKKCVNCGSQTLAQSRLKSIRERLLKALGNRPYRCLDCGWRGYVTVTDRRKAVKIVIGFVLVIVFFVWVAVAAFFVFDDSIQKYQSRINKKAMAKPKPKPKPKPEPKPEAEPPSEDTVQDILKR